MKLLTSDDVLTGDVTLALWKKVLKVAKKQYQFPVEQRYAELRESGKENIDRDDIFRDVFNTMCPPETYGNPEALKAFYTSDIFSRLLVYEAPDTNMLRGLIEQGTQMLSYPEEPAAAVVAYFEKTLLTKGTAIDLGFGSGYMGIGFALTRLFASVRMYDFTTPARTLLKTALAQFWTDCPIHVCDLTDFDAQTPPESVDFVISHEVLEHTADPEAELVRMRKVMKPGGLLWLSTFFNSCDGKNPSHLTSHDKFQDTELWFSVVKRCGFEHYFSDPRGVPKLFKAV